LKFKAEKLWRREEKLDQYEKELEDYENQLNDQRLWNLDHNLTISVQQIEEVIRKYREEHLYDHDDDHENNHIRLVDLFHVLMDEVEGQLELDEEEDDDEDEENLGLELSDLWEEDEEEVAP